MDGVEYYKSKSGQEYILYLKDGKYHTLNINGGPQWVNPTTNKMFAIDRLTKMNGKFVFEKTKLYVKKASDIVKILEDDGYEVNDDGHWHDVGGGLTFSAQMFQFAGHVVDDRNVVRYWAYLPEWLEER